MELLFDRIKKRLVISVRDTGIGMKVDDLKKLFKFFGQASSSKNII